MNEHQTVEVPLANQRRLEGFSPALEQGGIQIVLGQYLATADLD
jgi:hypothetical protein